MRMSKTIMTFSYLLIIYITAPVLVNPSNNNNNCCCLMLFATIMRFAWVP